VALRRFCQKSRGKPPLVYAPGFKWLVATILIGPKCVQEIHLLLTDELGKNFIASKCDLREWNKLKDQKQGLKSSEKVLPKSI
jgi:hypothetical protein